MSSLKLHFNDILPLIYLCFCSVNPANKIQLTNAQYTPYSMSLTYFNNSIILIAFTVLTKFYHFFSLFYVGKSHRRDAGRNILILNCHTLNVHSVQFAFLILWNVIFISSSYHHFNYILMRFSHFITICFLYQLIQ